MYVGNPNHNAGVTMGSPLAHQMRATATELEGGTVLRVGVPDQLPEWRLAMRCRGCGRWLTDPDSVRAGIGPACAAREVP